MVGVGRMREGTGVLPGLLTVRGRLLRVWVKVVSVLIGTSPGWSEL